VVGVHFAGSLRMGVENQGGGNKGLIVKLVIIRYKESIIVGGVGLGDGMYFGEKYGLRGGRGLWGGWWSVWGVTSESWVSKEGGAN